jgi:hypothetical protein
MASVTSGDLQQGAATEGDALFGRLGNHIFPANMDNFEEAPEETGNSIGSWHECGSVGGRQ